MLRSLRVPKGIYRVEKPAPAKVSELCYRSSTMGALELPGPFRSVTTVMLATANILSMSTLCRAYALPSTLRQGDSLYATAPPLKVQTLLTVVTIVCCKLAFPTGCSTIQYVSFLRNLL